MRDEADFSIKSEIEYEDVMGEIEELMEKGESNLTVLEADRVRNMALAAQNFERKHYRTAMPETLPEMISLKMYEMRLNQTELAKELGVSDTKLSMIMHGRQQPDVKFIKAVHTKLNVSADFLLKHI